MSPRVLQAANKCLWHSVYSHFRNRQTPWTLAFA
jgi:hypothetical protein